MPSTHTHTHTYTKPRSEVVRDQFELFLRYTGMPPAERELILAAIARGDLDALGAFLERDGFRFVEVELTVDRKLHAQLKIADGDMFDTDQPGWEDNVSPEVNQYARQISRIAKRERLKVRHWIMVNSEIRANPKRHKSLCESLGFSFGSSPPPWPHATPREREIEILDLPEMKIYERQA